MSFVASALKVVVGLAVFASLMILEFSSYTRAVGEEVPSPTVMKSQNLVPQTAPEAVSKTEKAIN